ncbi:uncharacterized protein LOC113204781 isoform X2 [Frankliniella occidentalis]|uniref:Uncharacterized protein LOC113204781 isoform X2 n=1 Tax=Frankliniella occidentalis TaxID=133901 RepID=A0A6J1S9D9_FRAOC|nr:uncharacterized protein LOC113204781 isoform X2 [Frankliniella occidentalis]
MTGQHRPFIVAVKSPRTPARPAPPSRTPARPNTRQTVSKMASQDDFKDVMRDIYKYSPLIELEDQELLQSWVKRLADACSSGKDQSKALDYARYLAYQLQRKQLRFPFSQPPTEGPLPDLKEVLFGPESDVTAAVLDTSCQVTGFRRALAQKKDVSFNDSAASWAGRGRDDLWDSHQGARGAASNWESHIADPKCERDVAAQMEELAEDAPLWLLLTRVCPHTRDAGALMHAVVAEELAEWSARLAAEQTVASQEPGQQQGDDDEEEEWGAKADGRADYWHEVAEVLRSLNKEDVSKVGHLMADICDWLTRQSRQLQAEHAQLQALSDELREAHRQVSESLKWREAQFEMQNRVLQTEVTSLRQSIDEKTKIFNLKIANKNPSGTAKRLSISQDSLDASKNSTNQSQ